MADYGQNSGRIDAMTQDAGIKDNVGQKVDGMIAENKQQHQETRENIQQQGVEVKKENAELENDHKTKGMISKILIMIRKSIKPDCLARIQPKNYWIRQQN
ncbi:hypothetical protein LNP59_27340 [Klebsiella pneumoniae subsp. pneumoniae]|nr:hypothetical protein [Klebsiella pneumoniae subsp. pneumoniae]